MLGKQAVHAQANSGPCSRSTTTSTQDRTQKGKTRSLREIYDATNMIENFFVSIVDLDVSALHSYVTNDTVAFVPILTLRQVLQSLDKDKWLEAVQVEVDALYKNHTWTVVQKPPNSNVVSCKWLFTKKYDAHGNIRFKAQLVARGFTQIPGVWIIMRLFLLHSNSPLSVLFLQSLPT